VGDLTNPSTIVPLAGEDALPVAVIQVAVLVGFLDRVAEVGGGVVRGLSDNGTASGGSVRTASSEAVFS
jgi:hypothetical protein